jgi:hypothetical protein
MIAGSSRGRLQAAHDEREESPDSITLQICLRQILRVKGNAPGNARGLRRTFREGETRRRGHGKCHREYTAGAKRTLRQARGKPRARLVWSSAFGKGEKVG